MTPQRALACALAVQLGTAGAVVAARWPAGGTDTLLVAPTANRTERFTSAIGALPYETPTALPTVVLPTVATPTALPSVAVPTVLPSLPPLPSVSVPPVPTVSVPPLPALPTSQPTGEPNCPEDAGAAELPEAGRSVSVDGEGGAATGPFSADGRVWFSVSQGPSAPHFVGVDTGTGNRLTIPAGKKYSFLYDVAGDRAWTTEENDVVVRYTANGNVLHRWDFGSLTYDAGDYVWDLMPASVAADAAGAWVLGFAGGGQVVLVRLANDGSVEWQTPLPDPPATGFSPGRGKHLAVHAGTAYVGLQGESGVAFWRVSPTGAITATSRPHFDDLINSDVNIVATAAGVYATVIVDENLDSIVLRLDPAGLDVTGQQRADTVEGLFADAGHVYVVGLWCSFLLSRYDAATMERTGFWRSDQSRQAYQGAVHEGAPWLLHTDGSSLQAVALRRYVL
jgi:hypothetical protein